MNLRPDRITGRLLFTCVLLASAATAFASSPRLRDVSPAGAQRGQTVEITIRGDRLVEPQELILYDAGMTVEKLETADPKKHKQVKATVKIAPDCRLGEHRLRLRTSRGFTELATFYVGALPRVEEKEPNNDLDTAQKIETRVTVEGVVKNEDVDLYRIEAKKGQRISAEVEGIRLGRTLLDPYVAILDAKRFELAAADDTPLLQQDAFVTVTAPEDGTYAILVRDSAYGGNNDSRYRLHVGDFPRPTAVYPAGGRPGESVKLRYLGDPAGEIVSELPLPAEAPSRLGVFAHRDQTVSPSPNWVRVSDAFNTLEAEPNNDRDKATAAQGELPVALNGIIAEPGDVDWFAFPLKKNQQVRVRVWARNLRSPLDPVLNVYDPKGKHLKGSDDVRNDPDSLVDIKADADGLHYARVRDHLERGGADFVYRIEVTTPEPSLSLSIPHIKRYDSQTNQWAAVPQGNRTMVHLRADRDNFGGDLKLIAENLPKGVTMHAMGIDGATNETAVVFEAQSDAPIAGTLADLRGVHEDDKKKIEGRFQQVADLVRGNPNRTAYYSTTVDRLPVAVTRPAPYRVKIVEPKIPLLQDGQMDLKIVVERNKDFDEEIRVKLPFRPPGVNARSEIRIGKGKTEGSYPVNARGNARPGKWPLAVEAHAAVDGGDLYVSSQLATLEVAPALVHGKIAMAVTEQGQDVQVVCELDPKQPFEGEAKLELFGLPNKVTTEPAKITKDTKQVVFKVKTDPKSPVGRHKSLFCRLSLVQHGETMLQSLAGGGTLRIDKPRPAPKAQAQAKKPDEKAKKSEPKRLTRLEQLRLEQEKQRAEARKK